MKVYGYEIRPKPLTNIPTLKDFEPGDFLEVYYPEGEPTWRGTLLGFTPGGNLAVLPFPFQHRRGAVLVDYTRVCKIGDRRRHRPPSGPTAQSVRFPVPAPK